MGGEDAGERLALGFLIAVIDGDNEPLDPEAADEFLFDIPRDARMRPHADFDDAFLSRALEQPADLGARHAEALGKLLLRHLIRVVERGDLRHHVEFGVFFVEPLRHRRSLSHGKAGRGSSPEHGAACVPRRAWRVRPIRE